MGLTITERGKERVQTAEFRTDLAGFVNAQINAGEDSVTARAIGLQFIVCVLCGLFDGPDAVVVLTPVAEIDEFWRKHGDEVREIARSVELNEMIERPIHRRNALLRCVPPGRVN